LSGPSARQKAGEPDGNDHWDNPGFHLGLSGGRSYSEGGVLCLTALLSEIAPVPQGIFLRETLVELHPFGEGIQ
jgi:hypothetical protein